ncbi:hypothetical protein KP509_31G013700 [Ceratopteris richardii]|uniref:Dirigent protein n=1 Tax=Ceratopteris richardii TaxID=49495 RepID=A0A8T2QXS1_CERRI|nr:hypothetical protein KP509_31G013700 [Ceratopteris richardii]
MIFALYQLSMAKFISPCSLFSISALAVVFFLQLHWPLPSVEATTSHKRPIPTLTVYNALIIQGPNSTKGFNAVQCGGPAVPLPNMFGNIYCFDMPLLKAQDLNSELYGTVQGSWVASKITGGTIVVSETFIFPNQTSLGYVGTFSGLGIENIGQQTSKPITGGTGDFELVTGIAITTPLGPATIDANGNTFLWFKYEFKFGCQCPSSCLSP